MSPLTCIPLAPSNDVPLAPRSYVPLASRSCVPLPPDTYVALAPSTDIPRVFITCWQAALSSRRGARARGEGLVTCCFVRGPRALRRARNLLSLSFARRARNLLSLAGRRGGGVLPPCFPPRDRGVRVQGPIKKGAREDFGFRVQGSGFRVQMTTNPHDKTKSTNLRY